MKPGLEARRLAGGAAGPGRGRSATSHHPCEKLRAESLDGWHDKRTVEKIIVLFARRFGYQQAPVSVTSQGSSSETCRCRRCVFPCCSSTRHIRRCISPPPDSLSGSRFGGVGQGLLRAPSQRPPEGGGAAALRAVIHGPPATSGRSPRQTRPTPTAKNCSYGGGFGELFCGRQTASGAERSQGPSLIDRSSPAKRVRKCRWPSHPLSFGPRRLRRDARRQFGPAGLAAGNPWGILPQE